MNTIKGPWVGAVLAAASVVGAQTAPLTTPVPTSLAPRALDQAGLKSSLSADQLRKLVENQTLTLKDAVGIGLAANRSLAVSIENLEKASGRKGEARAYLNPTIGGTANVSQYGQSTIINLGAGDVVAQEQFYPIYSVGLTLPVDISGSIRAAVSQAQFLEVASRIDVNRTRNQVVYDIKSAFFQALRSQAQLNVASDNLNNALNRLGDAQKNFNAGTASKFDVITVNRDVADAQQVLVNAKAQVTLSLAALKSTLGIDIDVPIKISDAGAVEQPAETASPTPTQLVTSDGHLVENQLPLGPAYDQVVKEALATRPELLEAEAQISAAKKGVEYARRSTLPSMSVGASYVYMPNANPFSLPHSQSVNVMLSVPIWDGGVARARAQEAKAEVSAAETSKRTTVDLVKLDVQQAYVNLLQAQERVQVSAVGLAQAQESFRLARLRYETGVSQQSGVSPQLEVSTAQVSLTQAQTNRVNALYDYNLARAQLDRAAGRYSYAK